MGQKSRKDFSELDDLAYELEAGENIRRNLSKKRPPSKRFYGEEESLFQQKKKKKRSIERKY